VTGYRLQGLGQNSGWCQRSEHHVYQFWFFLSQTHHPRRPEADDGLGGDVRSGGSDLGAGAGAGRGRRPWGRAHACRRQRPRGGTNALRAEQARAWDGELGAEHARAGGSHVGAEQSGAGSAPRWGGAGRGRRRAMLGRSRQGPVARHFGAEQAGASGEGKRRWPNQEEDNRVKLSHTHVECSEAQNSGVYCITALHMFVVLFLRLEIIFLGFSAHLSSRLQISLPPSSR
jgi:hypothetical protein